MKSKWDSLSYEERIETLEKRGALDRFRNPTDEFRKKLSDRMTGDKNPVKNIEVRKKISKTLKTKWGKFFSDQMKENWKKGIMPYPWERGPVDTFPNKQEVKLNEILEKESPDFVYVGDSSFWIGPCKSGKRRNPDFINKKLKKVILLHGEYWHTEEDARIQEEDYRSRNWEVLTIWTRELKVDKVEEMIEKLKLFGRS